GPRRCSRSRSTSVTASLTVQTDYHPFTATGVTVTLTSSRLHRKRDALCRCNCWPASASCWALGAGRVADRYGRLPAMRAAAVLFLIGAVGSGLASSLVSWWGSA